MSEHGATLQTYNQELVKCLEDLKIRRNEILTLITQEEADKKVIERDIQVLQEKLMVVSSNLQKHQRLYQSYEKTIKDTEGGFRKILESSQMLLNLAQQEANKLHTCKKNVPHTSYDHLHPDNRASIVEAPQLEFE